MSAKVELRAEIEHVEGEKTILQEVIIRTPDGVGRGYGIFAINRRMSNKWRKILAAYEAGENYEKLRVRGFALIRGQLAITKRRSVLYCPVDGEILRAHADAVDRLLAVLKQEQDDDRIRGLEGELSRIQELGASRLRLLLEVQGKMGTE